MNEILDELIEIDGQVFRMMLSASEFEDNSDVGIEIAFTFLENDLPVCNGKYRGVITNPIEIGAILLGAATTYGLCVGRRFILGSWDITKQSYDESKKDSNMKLLDRAKDTVRRNCDKPEEFKKSGGKALRKCVIKIPFLSDEDNDEDQD